MARFRAQPLFSAPGRYVYGAMSQVNLFAGEACLLLAIVCELCATVLACLSARHIRRTGALKSLNESTTLVGTLRWRGNEPGHRREAAGGSFASAWWGPPPPRGGP